MSDTPETDAFIDSLHDDWDVEFANLKAHACKLERERDKWRECAAERKQAWYEMQSAFERSRDEVNALEREINNLIDQRDCAITIHESHLASSRIQTSILAEKHNEMLRSRDQWRECAERLDGRLRKSTDWTPYATYKDNQQALAEFDRLKEETK